MCACFSLCVWFDSTPFELIVFHKIFQIGSLTIPSVKKKDTGNLTCQPSNSDSINIMLHVINGECFFIVYYYVWTLGYLLWRIICQFVLHNFHFAIEHTTLFFSCIGNFILTIAICQSFKAKYFFFCCAQKKSAHKISKPSVVYLQKNIKFPIFVGIKQIFHLFTSHPQFLFSLFITGEYSASAITSSSSTRMLSGYLGALCVILMVFQTWHCKFINFNDLELLTRNLLSWRCTYQRC